MRSQAPRSDTHPQCPSCGSSPLPELSEPSGMALCLRCGSLLRRTDRGLHSVGLSTED